MAQHIKGFLNTFGGQVLPLHDVLVCLSTANDIVRLHGEHFLHDIGCAERFQCPHFHFTETLPAELCLTAQRLLGNQGVGPDRTRVHFIINHVTQFHHIDNANRSRLMETLSGKSVVQVGTSCIGKLGLVDPSFHFVMFRSIKNWSCKTNAQLFSGPTEYSFVNLSQVHPRRHTQWIKKNTHRPSVFQEWHIFFTYDTRSEEHTSELQSLMR